MSNLWVRAGWKTDFKPSNTHSTLVSLYFWRAHQWGRVYGIILYVFYGFVKKIKYAGISFMHAPNNCAPPVPRNDAPSIMHPPFSWEIQRKIHLLHKKVPFNCAPPPGRRSDAPSIMQVQTYWGGCACIMHV